MIKYAKNEFNCFKWKSLKLSNKNEMWIKIKMQKFLNKSGLPINFSFAPLKF